MFPGDRDNGPKHRFKFTPYCRLSAQPRPPLSITGYLDANDGWSVQGWAFDEADPGRAVVVELLLGSGYKKTVIADQFREDLRVNGVGDGRHAFTFKLPSGELAGPGASIAARIAGTEIELTGSPMPLCARQSVGLVAGDIVNNCNLRCPFCIVDYTNIRGLKLMNETSFERVKALLPLMPRGNLWLSCLHEPTLHPRFMDFIFSVPPETRRCISFTTNLSRPMTEDQIERLANSGVGSIRVSFDSDDPAQFEQLRVGAKFGNFQANLLSLARHLRTSRDRPWFEIITMAFRPNHLRIPGLVAYCKDQLGADSHDVRFIYFVPHVAPWGREHILDMDEWSRLESAMQPLRQRLKHLTLSGPAEGAHAKFAEDESLKDYVARETAFGGSDDASSLPIPDAVAIGSQLMDQPLKLRLRWDGLMMIEDKPESFFRVDINRLTDPRSYFETMRIAAREAVR